MDAARLAEIIDHDFPDLRTIANRLEFEFVRKKVAEGSPEETPPLAKSSCQDMNLNRPRAISLAFRTGTLIGGNDGSEDSSC